MTYGLNKSAFIENGAAVRVQQLRLSRSIARSWSLLDRARRLALIDRALRPGSDGFPLAL